MVIGLLVLILSAIIVPSVFRAIIGFFAILFVLATVFGDDISKATNNNLPLEKAKPPLNERTQAAIESLSIRGPKVDVPDISFAKLPVYDTPSICRLLVTDAATREINDDVEGAIRTCIHHERVNFQNLAGRWKTLSPSAQFRCVQQNSSRLYEMLDVCLGVDTMPWISQ